MSIIRFRSIHVIGPGLIGGSFGLACRTHGIRVTGASPYPAELRRARRAGAIDAAAGISDLAPDTDLIVVAAPVDAIPGVLRRLRRATRDRGVPITDTGSVKEPIVRAAQELLSDPDWFVGGHPMAGSERSGVEAARANLFENAAVVLTPTADTRADAIARVQAAWKTVGGRTHCMDASVHDACVADISHLPYLAAVALMRAVERQSLTLAAGGFRDTTRVAASDARLWAGILRANRGRVAQSLERLIAELAEFRQVLTKGEGRGLRARLAAGQRARTSLAK